MALAQPPAVTSPAVASAESDVAAPPAGTGRGDVVSEWWWLQALATDQHTTVQSDDASTRTNCGTRQPHADAQPIAATARRPHRGGERHAVAQCDHSRWRLLEVFGVSCARVPRAFDDTSSPRAQRARSSAEEAAERAGVCQQFDDLVPSSASSSTQGM